TYAERFDRGPSAVDERPNDADEHRRDNERTDERQPGKTAVSAKGSAQPGRAQRDGSVSHSEVDHGWLGWKVPQTKERDAVSEDGDPALIFINPYSFAKGSLRKLACARTQRPPFQPWTWSQLAVIFCFTGSGKVTKSRPAASWSPFL